MKKVTANEQLLMYPFEPCTHLEGDKKLRIKTRSNEPSIWSFILHLQTLDAFTNVSDDFVIIIRRLFNKVVHPVIQCLLEELANGVIYQKLFATIASQLKSQSVAKSLSTPESCALCYWKCRLCANSLSSTDSLSEQVSYFFFNKFGED